MRSSTTDYFYFRTRQQLKCYIMPHFMATHQVLGEISTVFTLQLKTKMSPLALHFSTLRCFNLASSSLQSSKRSIYFFCVCFSDIYQSTLCSSRICLYWQTRPKLWLHGIWEKETMLQGNWNTLFYDTKRADKILQNLTTLEEMLTFHCRFHFHIYRWA